MRHPQARLSTCRQYCPSWPTIHLARVGSTGMVGAMDRNQSAEAPSFGARLGMAFRVLFNAGFAREVEAGLRSLKTVEAKPAAPKVPAAELAPERVHASGLMVLAALQREGRLIDFLQQDVTGFSDEDVGVAARIVHSGCSKVVKQYFEFEPAVSAAEGAIMVVPAGFDAQRIRLTGNVAGQPPFKGTIKHHGWFAKAVRLPALASTLDARIIAPAEVELA